MGTRKRSGSGKGKRSRYIAKQLSSWLKPLVRPGAKLKFERAHKPWRTVTPKGLYLKPRGPNGILYIKGTGYGRRRRETTGTSDRVEAELQLARRIVQWEKLYQGRGLPLRATYGEASEGRLSECRPSERTLEDARKWVELIGAGTLVEDIDWPRIRELATARLLKKSNPPSQTLKRVVVEVKATLIWAATNFGEKRGCVQKSFPRLADGRPRSVWVEPDTAVRMHQQAALERLQLVADVIVFCTCEAARVGEVFGFRWELVKLLDRYMTLLDVKSGSAIVRDRVIDPRPRTMELLAEIQARLGRTSGPVFVRDDGREFLCHKAMGKYLNAHLKRLAKDAGHPQWEEVTCHALRHTAATWEFIRTGELYSVEQRFDWESSDSAKRYIKKASRNLQPHVESFLGYGPPMPGRPSLPEVKTL